MNTLSTIPLNDARQLEKRLGVWIWDGLLFNRDGILNPQLTILPNESGTRIRRFLAEMGDDWRGEA